MHPSRHLLKAHSWPHAALRRNLAGRVRSLGHLLLEHAAARAPRAAAPVPRATLTALSLRLRGAERAPCTHAPSRGRIVRVYQRRVSGDSQFSCKSGVLTRPQPLKTRRTRSATNMRTAPPPTTPSTPQGPHSRVPWAHGHTKSAHSATHAQKRDRAVGHRASAAARDAPAPG